MSVIYTLGPDGSYSSKAARKAKECSKYPLIFRNTIRSVIESTLTGNYGVVPLHNTYGGVIHDTEAGLIYYKDSLHVISLIKLKITHCLASANGEKGVKELKAIYSHPQAIKQCEGYLKNIDALCIPAASTTEYIGGLSYGEGVICDEEIAQSSGLTILEKNICPDDNVTEFGLITTLNNKS